MKNDVGMSWERMKIKDITINLDNKRKPLNEAERNKISKKQLYPYIGANNIMGYVDEFLYDEEIVCIAEDGGSWGENQKCCVHIHEKCWVNNHAHVLGTNGKTDLKFLMYYLNANDLNKFITGSTRGKLTKSALDSIQIPLPPLHIQKRIAEILDAADALKRKDQALLKKYDELAQAIFIDMFGDPDENPNNFNWVNLESICEEVVDCPHSTPIHTEVPTNYPCIRTSEMKNGKIIWNKMKYLDYENYLIRIKRLIPKAGDIVYAREGTYGEAVILPQGFEFALGQRTMLLRTVSEKCDNFFIWYFINSDFVYRQAQRKNMGSTVGHVNVADVKKFQILLPPIELQRKFGDILKITNEIWESTNLKSFTDDLFQALIQKAFKGELVAE